ncbi:SPS1-related proline-alanine-rich protein kinase [Seminavis robusta]|uniref:SPS1-related proline-alanine-rich protein kinase n=1 Tax=Seminavis robusta TaxID=568900 RepID=A0A9N8H9F0_9STRA|nr:SPS1-related proline-alanine-rich protein kinase [Seminavis robusta]|eukprot:Sro252_g099590.1 SPS1-related proline-alanine-rich protein kinase (435) ;mRNA; r:25830-27134
MFLKRSSSFHGGAKNGQANGTTSTTTPTTSTSPLRMWRRKQHRRSQSADDADSNAAAVASAVAAQFKAEQEELWRLKRREIQLGKILGEGGFAQVFSVTTKRAQLYPWKRQKLALKQLRPELLKDKTLFARAASSLVQESRIMAQLKGHPHILQLRGVSDEEEEPLPTKRGFDSFFLVTDALRETMTDRLLKWQENPSSSRKVLEQRWNHQLQYALQTAKALVHCHENGIIFRDCKADNLGFSDDHTVQLFDFGMARELPCEDFDDAQTCASSLDDAHGGEELFQMTMCGTQRHVAPEVYNRGWYNLKADSYSFAMTVLELVTGKKPFPGMSLPVHKILVLEGGGRPNVDAFPAGLQAILRQAWAQNISERWTMAQVCAALETYIGSADCSRHDPTNASNKTAAPVLQDQARSNNLAATRQRTACKKSMLASAA